MIWQGVMTASWNGQQWYDVLTVTPDDPVIQALRESGQMIECDPSPSEIASERRKAEEKRERLEQEAAYKRSRQEHFARMKAQGEERSRKAAAQREAGR